MRSSTSVALLFFVLPFTQAAPLFGITFGSESKSATTPVSQDTIDNQLTRPALFSRVAYCSPASVSNLSCGAPCDALGDVQILATGGDGGVIPRFFVAHDPSADSIVVAHQGTDPDNILSIANDVNFVLQGLNSTLFPNAGDAQVHDGFAYAQDRTADTVLSTVQSALASTGAKTVAVTGHSLGAAIAVMDSVMLKMLLDPSITVSTTVFGLPRGGNQAWADLVDSTLGTNLTHVTNQDDPVPRVPPQLLGFQQPSGEFHITAVDASGAATMVACPGQENDDCIDANSLLDASVANHDGPYFSGISFGGSACPA